MIKFKTLKKLVRKGLSVVGLVDSALLTEAELMPIPQEPMPPLLERLGLHEMPNGLNGREQAEFVLNAIRTAADGKFAKKISRRVLGKVVVYYGVKPIGFRRVPNRPNMLLVPATAC